MESVPRQTQSPHSGYSYASDSPDVWGLSRYVRSALNVLAEYDIVLPDDISIVQIAPKNDENGTNLTFDRESLTPPFILQTTDSTTKLLQINRLDETPEFHEVSTGPSLFCPFRRKTIPQTKTLPRVFASILRSLLYLAMMVITTAFTNPPLPARTDWYQWASEM